MPNQTSYDPVTIATKIRFSPDEIRKIAAALNIPSSAQEFEVLTAITQFDQMMKQQGHKTVAKAIAALSQPAEPPSDCSVSEAFQQEFANPFDGQSTSGLEVEFDQTLTQLLALTSAHQLAGEQAMQEMSVVQKMLEEMATEQQIRDRYLLIARGAIPATTDLEKLFLQTVQAMKKKPLATGLQWKEGKVVLKIQPQRSSLAPLQLAALAAQNGGQLPAVIGQLPQLPASSVNGLTHLPTQLKYLLSGSDPQGN